MNKTILFLLLFPMLVLAQGISLEGNVVDTDSNDPLPGCHLQVHLIQNYHQN